MAAIFVERFDGMEPSTAPRLLNDTAGTAVINANLLDGTLRGIHAPQLLRVIDTGPVVYQSSYKIRYRPGEGDQSVYTTTWADFPHPFTDLVKGPLVNDRFERYYYTSPGGKAGYNLADRIALKAPGFKLGIPRAAKPSLGIQAAVDQSLTSVTRSYVVTYVSAYGEEGPPSEPVTLVGKPNDTWQVTLPPAPATDTEGRHIALRRIYRTVFASNGVTNFMQVAEVLLGSATYADRRTDLEIAGAAGRVLESVDYHPPPEDLQGLMLMPDGFLVGFKGRDIYFSEKYRPHAWPPQYVLSAEHPIVGLGMFGNTCVVLTEGYPVGLTGIDPSAMSMTKTGVAEPCLSRGSIVSSPEGVYYASHNGLVLVNQGGITNITQGLIDKQTWKTRYRPEHIRAARYKTQYIGITDEGRGFIINLGNPRVALSEFTSLLSGQNLLNDPWTGEVHLIGRNRVYLWDPDLASPVAALWRSKEFVLPKAVNMGVMSIDFGIESAPLHPTLLGSFENEPPILIGSPPSPDLVAPVVPPPVYPPGVDDPRPRDLLPSYPMAIPPMMERVRLANDKSCRARIWADRILVFDHEFTAPQEVRLPSGFKSDTWQFEIISRVPVMKVVIGETTKDLRNV